MEKRIQQRGFSQPFAILAVLLWLGWWMHGVVVDAKELPIPATVRELAAESDQFDGHRVFVTGRVREINIERGRRGSEFVSMILEEVTPDAAAGPSVRVFSLSAPTIPQGSRVSVQGTYYREGRFGGWPYENFIEADAILREK